MKKIIQLCDLYKKPITLPIKSENKYSSTLGFIVTILTFTIFALHFYFESYEVFDRKHPNVFSNRNNFHITDKLNLKVSNETLKFFININISPSKENSLNYFDLIESNYAYWKDFYKHEWLTFRICNDDDLALFSHNLRTFSFPKGINICPKINFIIPAASFNTFELNFNLKECIDESKGCKRDQAFYEQLRNNTYLLRSSIYLVSTTENMINYDDPFYYKVIQVIHKKIPFSLVMNLEGSEINTEPLFGMLEPYKNSQLKYIGSDNGIPIANGLINYNIFFNTQDTTIHYRHYKTLNNAFSNFFSCFKLYSWVFSLLLNSYYSYNINNIIINKNFDYGKWITNSSNDDLKENINKFKNISEVVFNKRSLLITHLDEEFKKKLTLTLIYKKVSFCRYLVCSRKNKTKSFYENATRVIKKCLSVEQLIFHLIDCSRFKNSVIERGKLKNSEKDEFVLSYNKNEREINTTFDFIEKNVTNVFKEGIC
jgi:hypothetical protein